LDEMEQRPPSARNMIARCCIVGGGPAGMMLGYLLGRAGIDTIVLEKHADFLRDFRGDTVHPSTMQIMDELGLLQEFLKRPHQRISKLGGEFGGVRLRVADFTHVKTVCPFIAFMPQWDFLDFIAEASERFPSLKILKRTEVVDLMWKGDTVTGVVARTPEGELHVTADLTVGCDGRRSIVRERAGLTVEDIGAPMDVLWFRIGKSGASIDPALLHAEKGRLLVTLDRGDYWQCAFVIPKGQIEVLKARGLPAFKSGVVSILPELGEHIDDVRDWDDVKLLTVTIDRLKTWSRPGLLCIGDAAHAMSPVGGVGINLAIQDAVATANLLADKLRQGAVSADDLDAVRTRRLFPVKVIQAFQVQVQNRVLKPVLQGGELTPPLPLRIVNAVPWLQGMMARVVGLGVRPEHVHSPDCPRSE
jgi:2-polyprenyl-6-methoxyphenol hydroxylase-like FAD-dependent oxidoreductase